MMLLIYKPRRIQIITGIRSGLFRIVCDYVIVQERLGVLAATCAVRKPKSKCRQKSKRLFKQGIVERSLLQMIMCHT